MNIFNFAKQEELKKLESLVLELKQSLKETNEQIEKLQEKNKELEQLVQEQKSIQTEPYKEKPKRGRPFKKTESINENNISKTISNTGKRRGRPKKEVPDAAVMGLDFPEEEIKEKKVRKYKKKPSPKINVEKIETYSDVIGSE